MTLTRRIEMPILFALAASMALASPTLAAEPIAARGAVIIIDGDTVRIDGVTIRLLDIDTPETDRPRCENELSLGLEASERLRQLLDAGPVAYVVDGHDRYDASAHALNSFGLPQRSTLALAEKGAP
ncbi:thermonuclease family protein [Mesorhizobium sp.]|uniref:thermonuclease family protein n=1 Tax=Mesorhizobium sp. TaxID=1871066 RepID=UPI000FEA3CDE|nr:thermonuclease family protein [Mesorhizobium sp.]RWN58453.1 MAG: hypothetical protein EOS00_21215 [Mesorhizobium sp.]